MGSEFLLLFLLFHLSVGQFHTRDGFRRNLHRGRFRSLFRLNCPDVPGHCLLAFLQNMGSGFLLLLLLFHLSVAQFHAGDNFRWNLRSRYRFHDLFRLNRPDVPGRCLLAFLQNMGSGFLLLLLLFHLSVAQFHARDGFRRNLNTGRFDNLFRLHCPNIPGRCLLPLFQQLGLLILFLLFRLTGLHIYSLCGSLNSEGNLSLFRSGGSLQFM